MSTLTKIGDSSQNSAKPSKKRKERDISNHFTMFVFPSRNTAKKYKMNRYYTQEANDNDEETISLKSK